MSEFEKLIDFVKGRKVITTKALCDAFGWSEWTAYKMMSLLMQRGLVAHDWDVYQGGFPVLKGEHASAN